MWVVGLYFLLIQSGGSPWRTGDWLINYQAGFVRRGLIGELLYIISPYGWLLMSVFFVQSLIYITICHFVIEEFFSKKRGIVDGVIVFSPAFIFLFSFNHPNAGMRKEMIAFLSFVLLLEATKKNKNNWLLWLSILIFALGVFSHEMIALFVFFYIYSFLKRSDALPYQKASYVLLLIVISLSGLYFSSIFHGNILVAHSICSSLALKGVDSDMCGGAISALSGTTLSSMSWVRADLPANFIYLPLFALAFTPFAFINWRRYFPVIFLGFISVLPLFIVAVDWGRWIYVCMTFVFLVYIYDAEKVGVDLNVSRPLLFFFAFYLLAWSLPHFEPDLMRISGAFMMPYKVWQVISNIISSLSRG